MNQQSYVREMLLINWPRPKPWAQICLLFLFFFPFQYCWLIRQPGWGREGISSWFRGVYYLLGCPASPVINSVFGRLWRKTASRGREDTWVWYRETMFSQMVSYDFSLHGALHGYFLYLVSAPPEKPTRRCEPEEGYLRCSKRFDHGSHSIIFLLFEFKSVRWCWRWETQRNAHVAYKPTRRSR